MGRTSVLGSGEVHDVESVLMSLEVEVVELLDEQGHARLSAPNKREQRLL